MREDILQLLRTSDRALSIYDIQDKLHLKTAGEVRELQNMLQELEEEVLI